MKTIVGIFAHPDDEAFGPAGTLAQYAKENNVFLICVTNGEGGGKIGEDKKRIGEIRKKELLESAGILGIKQVFFLNFADGGLCNNLYHQIADDLQKILEKLRPETLITYEQRGMSGHLDHIAVSMITTYVFYQCDFAKRLLLNCYRKEVSNDLKDYFIYFPPGYTKEEVDTVIDVSDVWEQKVQAMKAHTSQPKDVKAVLGSQQKYPKEEFFFVLEK